MDRTKEGPLTQKLLFTAASAVLMASTANAQPPVNLYQTLVCVKAVPGKSAEYRQFLMDTTKLVAQARANAGEIVSWSLLRSVMPAGSEARCDYMISTVFEGIPPEPTGRDQMAAALKRAGVNMTASEFYAKRDSLSHLVAQEMWRMRAREGRFEKGHYLFLNYMKVHDAAGYTKFETDVYRPLVQQMIKDGTQGGWVYSTLVLPSGTDTAYTAMSADIYPSWAAAFQSRNAADAFKKAHPGKDLEHTFENLSKLRDLARREMMVFEERVTKQ